MAQMIEMDPAQFAKAMASRVVRERARIALRIEEFTAAQPTRDDVIRDALYALAEEIRTGTTPPPMIVPREPMAAAQVLDEFPGVGEEEAELPPVRHMDDFTEGVAMVQGSRFRSGVTGRLRADLPTD